MHCVKYFLYTCLIVFHSVPCEVETGVGTEDESLYFRVPWLYGTIKAPEHK